MMQIQIAPGFHQSPKVEIIWTITRLCGWDCSPCCVDADNVTKRDGAIVIRSKGLSEQTVIPYVETGTDTIFDAALHARQQAGLELGLEEKTRVLDHMRGYNVKLDISGGDPLCAKENFALLKLAALRFGSGNITLTATGAGLSRYQVADIAPHVAGLNFTYDSPAPKGSLRPNTYARVNLKKARDFARAGVRTRAEFPLATETCGDDDLRRLYLDLHDAGINTLLVMRLFPVGRGQLVRSSIPSRDQYRKAIATLRNLEAIYKQPKLKLQCALRALDEGPPASNPCDMIEKSFGLMANGTLLASPWAIDAIGQPLHPSWVLGNLATTDLGQILASPAVCRFAGRLGQNFGECKIFSFLYSAKADPTERMLDTADPLFQAGETIAPLPIRTPGELVQIAPSSAKRNQALANAETDTVRRVA